MKCKNCTTNTSFINKYFSFRFSKWLVIFLIFWFSDVLSTMLILKHQTSGVKYAWQNNAVFGSSKLKTVIFISPVLKPDHQILLICWKICGEPHPLSQLCITLNQNKIMLCRRWFQANKNKSPCYMPELCVWLKFAFRHLIYSAVSVKVVLYWNFLVIIRYQNYSNSCE